MENKENYDFLEKKNRTRGENWTREEKDIFLQIMAFSASIIENKRTDTNTNKRKSLEWVKIKNKMKELTGVHREVSQLKGFWRRIKLMAKKSRQEASPAASGGQQSPPPDDVCPMDFAVAQHVFDQISQFKNSQDSQDSEEIHNHTMLSNEEVNEDTDEPGDPPKVKVEVIVGEDYNNEAYGECSQNNSDNNTFKAETPINLHQRNIIKRKAKYKNTSKAGIIAANIELKKKAAILLEEEYSLKIKYQKEEIAHQKLRHKMEQDILLLQKLKLELEIDALKKKN